MLLLVAAALQAVEHKLAVEVGLHTVEEVEHRIAEVVEHHIAEGVRTVDGEVAGAAGAAGAAVFENLHTAE